MYKVIEDLRVLNPISKKFNLDFCKQYKYYNGDSNSNNKGECLPLKFKHKDKIYKLKYFDGCFNPFLIELIN